MLAQEQDTSGDLPPQRQHPSGSPAWGSCVGAQDAEGERLPSWKESCLEDGPADGGFARGTAVFLFMAFVSGAYRMAGSCGCIVPVTACTATMTGHQTPNQEESVPGPPEATVSMCLPARPPGTAGHPALVLNTPAEAR